MGSMILEQMKGEFALQEQKTGVNGKEVNGLLENEKV